MAAPLIHIPKLPDAFCWHESGLIVPTCITFITDARTIAEFQKVDPGCCWTCEPPLPSPHWSEFWLKHVERGKFPGVV